MRQPRLSDAARDFYRTGQNMFGGAPRGGIDGLIQRTMAQTLGEMERAESQGWRPGGREKLDHFNARRRRQQRPLSPGLYHLRNLQKLGQRARLNGVGPQFNSAEAKVDQALQYVNAMMETLNSSTQVNVQIVNGNDASASGNTARIGRDLIYQVDTLTLAQIIAHEVGHVAEGHTSPEMNAIMQALRDENVISQSQFNQLMRNDEHTADFYSAVLAWAFDGRAEPGISSWLRQLDQSQSDTHPDSQVRADNIYSWRLVLDSPELAQAIAESSSYGDSGYSSFAQDSGYFGDSDSSFGDGGYGGDGGGGGD